MTLCVTTGGRLGLCVLRKLKINAVHSLNKVVSYISFFSFLRFLHHYRFVSFLHTHTHAHAAFSKCF